MIEFEYIVTYIATKEIMWMRQLLSNLGYPQFISIHFFCNNQSSIQVIHNPKFHNRTKHIDVKFHFIRIFFIVNTTTYYVSMIDQVVNLFIKALQSD